MVTYIADGPQYRTSRDFQEFWPKWWILNPNLMFELFSHTWTLIRFSYDYLNSRYRQRIIFEMPSSYQCLFCRCRNCSQYIMTFMRYEWLPLRKRQWNQCRNFPGMEVFKASTCWYSAINWSVVNEGISQAIRSVTPYIEQLLTNRHTCLANSVAALSSALAYSGFLLQKL